MGDLKKLYKTDESLETSGVWESIGNGIKVKVARFNNTNHKRIMEVLMKPHQHSLRNNTLAEDVAEELLIKGMAKAVLLDWEGLEEDGVPVKYSNKESIRVLTEYKDFRSIVRSISESMEVFKHQDDEETEKNFEATSTGQSESGTN